MTDPDSTLPAQSNRNLLVLWLVCGLILCVIALAAMAYGSYKSIADLKTVVADLNGKLEATNKKLDEVNVREFTLTNSFLKELSVRNLKVVDSSGEARITLSVDEAGIPTQIFHDESHVDRLFVGITPEGTSRVRMFDEKGTVRNSSSVTRTDSESPVAGSTIYDITGKPEASILGPRIYLYDPETKKTSLSLSGAYKGWSGVRHIYKNGKMAAFSGTDGDDASAFSLRDTEENIRAQLYFNNDSAGVQLNDTEKKQRVSLFINKQRFAGLGVYDVAGKTRHMTISGNAENNYVQSTSYDPWGNGRIFHGVNKDGRSYAEYLNANGETYYAWQIDRYGKLYKQERKTDGEAAMGVVNALGLMKSAADLFSGK